MLYERKTPTSKRIFERAYKVIPGGICHNIRYFPPYPFYVEKAEGPYIWDVDGNRYIDFWMGHYAHILGHNHPLISHAVSNFIKEKGFHFGIPNEWEVELAELIQELVPCAEAVRFCSSGTEATMYAVRLARAYTGRNVVVKITGGWHGASTDLSFGVSYPFDLKETLGVPDCMEAYTRFVKFNDIESLEKVIDEAGSDLACVIVEPVLGVGGFIPAEKDFLLKLKVSVEKLDAILIFDEIITGFRLSLGGYQKVCGVIPHIATLGKVLGGGFPIGAVVGKREILDFGSWERKKPLRVLMGGGTFSCNPVSMVAGVKILNFLKENESYVYERLNSLGDYLRKRISEEKFSFQVKTTGISSLFMIHFVKEGNLNIKCAEDIVNNTFWELRDTRFRVYMAERGFYLVHAGGAISLSHEESHIDAFVEALKDYTLKV